MVIAIVLAAAAGIAAIDQLIKFFVLEYLVPVNSVEVIKGLLSLVYVENRGVAFGMMQNHVWLFAVITLLLIGAMIYLIASKKLTGKLFYTAAILLIGGGIGNLIDRVFRGFVVDYLSLSFFPPVCNFADYCITIGAVLFVIVMLLSGKDDARKVKAPVSAAIDKDAGTSPGTEKKDAGQSDESTGDAPDGEQS